MGRGFNGTTEYLQGSSTTPTSGLTDFTLAAWISNGANGQTAFPVSWRNSAQTNGAFFLVELAQGAEIGMSNAGALSRKRWGSTLADGYHLFVGTHAAGSTALTLYVDGVAGGTASETAASNPGDSGVAMTVGRDGNGATPFYFQGAIAEVALWNAVLTAAEVAGMVRNRMRCFRPSALLGYWPIWGLQSPEPNLSGSSNSLTITGTALAVHAPVTLFTPKSRTPPDIGVAAATSLLLKRRRLLA